MSCLSHIFQKLTSFTKTWSILRQMLFFYGIAMVLILSLIISLTVFNLLYLKQQTLEQLTVTANSQARENLDGLISQGAASISSDINKIFSMFTTIEGIVNTRESAQGPETLPSYVYSDLPTSCMQIDTTVYGPDPVCFSHSSVLSLGDGYPEMLNLTSRLDYCLPYIQLLNAKLVSRIVLYFSTETGGFVRVFPGTNFPSDYDVTLQTWYTDLMKSGENVHGSPPYPDVLGSGELIISHSRILHSINGTMIGIASADTPVTYLSRVLVNITSFSSAESFIVSKDGTVIQFQGSSGLSDQVKNFKNISDDCFWEGVSNTPAGLFRLNYGGEEYAIATSPLGDKNDSGNWWYVLMISVNQAEILHYLPTTSDEFSKASLWLILITTGSCIFTLLSVVLCILWVERGVTNPLKGIINFTTKINANATDEDAVGIDELEELKEGQGQVARLVQVFKSLMRSLLETRELPADTKKKEVTLYSYPLNHLYGGGIRWKAQLNSLRTK